MIYSSVLVLVCAISMVSCTSTQQEIREKVEIPQWKVGDCILGKNNFVHFNLDSSILYFSTLVIWGEKDNFYVNDGFTCFFVI